MALGIWASANHNAEPTPEQALTEIKRMKLSGSFQEKDRYRLEALRKAVNKGTIDQRLEAKSCRAGCFPGEASATFRA